MTLYLPDIVSLAIRIVPSNMTERSARPGVASMSISIGELASTVDPGKILTPNVVAVESTRPNLISGELAIDTPKSSKRDAIRILFSCVSPDKFLVNIPLSSELIVHASCPLSFILILLFLRVLPLTIAISPVIFVPFSGVIIVIV